MLIPDASADANADANANAANANVNAKADADANANCDKLARRVWHQLVVGSQAPPPPPRNLPISHKLVLWARIFVLIFWK